MTANRTNRPKKPTFLKKNHPWSLQFEIPTQNNTHLFASSYTFQMFGDHSNNNTNFFSAKIIVGKSATKKTLADFWLVLIGLSPLEALWRNTVGRQGAAPWWTVGQRSRTLVVGWWGTMCRSIAYYKIELRLGIQRKMMKNDVFGNNSFNSSNELLNYLFGVGCIYILDDRRKCLDASPLPWCNGAPRLKPAVTWFWVVRFSVPEKFTPPITCD